jgi:hypothetical protein
VMILGVVYVQEVASIDHDSTSMCIILCVDSLGFHRII